MSKLILILQLADDKTAQSVGVCMAQEVQSNQIGKYRPEAESSIWQQAQRRKVSSDSWGGDIRYQNPLSYQPSPNTAEWRVASKYSDQKSPTCLPRSQLLHPSLSLFILIDRPKVRWWIQFTLHSDRASSLPDLSNCNLWACAALSKHAIDRPGLVINCLSRDSPWSGSQAILCSQPIVPGQEVAKLFPWWKRGHSEHFLVHCQPWVKICLILIHFFKLALRV